MKNLILILFVFTSTVFAHTGNELRRVYNCKEVVDTWDPTNVQLFLLSPKEGGKDFFSGRVITQHAGIIGRFGCDQIEGTNSHHCVDQDGVSYDFTTAYPDYILTTTSPDGQYKELYECRLVRDLI